MEDRVAIDRLGGSSKVAELLGFDKARGGVQRVSNWKKRGIPSAIKLLRPDLFPQPQTEMRTAVSA
ncbi:hypothetical protein [Cupriavidus respiraculi]